MREMHDTTHRNSSELIRKGSCGWGWFCFLSILAQCVLVSLLQRAKLTPHHIAWINKSK